jgi:fructokinase
MPDVLCLGEILVDWICRTPGAELHEAERFIKAPGGAPANTAVGLARQGISTGFIGRVSDDAFGAWLVSVLQENGIDTTGTIHDPHAQTRMAYVVTTLSGDRKLAEFTRVACADAQLSVEDIIPQQFERAHVLHFGSISLIANPSAQATRHAVDLARRHNLLISYDPN